MDIGWILSFGTITGALLNAFYNKWGFIIWIVTNFGWIAFNIHTGTISQIPVWVVLTLISVWGFIIWNKEEKK